MKEFKKGINIINGRTVSRFTQPPLARQPRDGDKDEHASLHTRSYSNINKLAPYKKELIKLKSLFPPSTYRLVMPGITPISGHNGPTTTIETHIPKGVPSGSPHIPSLSIKQDNRIVMLANKKNNYRAVLGSRSQFASNTIARGLDYRPALIYDSTYRVMIGMTGDIAYAYRGAEVSDLHPRPLAHRPSGVVATRARETRIKGTEIRFRLKRRLNNFFHLRKEGIPYRKIWFLYYRILMTVKNKNK